MWHKFTNTGAEAQRMWLQVNLQVSRGCLVHEKASLPQQQCCVPHSAGGVVNIAQFKYVTSFLSKEVSALHPPHRAAD